MPQPRLIFMGTPEFAVPTLLHLAQAGFEVLAVVTQPDKPRGRGQRETYSPVKLAALELGLPIQQPQDVNAAEVMNGLRAYAPEVIVVAAFGQILRAELLQLPKFGCVNLHASLLPRLRGAAPIQWALALGEALTGVTVQKMAEKVDRGEILVQRSLEIGADETAPELSARLAGLGGPAMAEALELLHRTKGHCGTPQEDALATWAPRLAREDGRIDWDLPAEAIHNRVRGFNPWPGTHTGLRGEMLKILSTRRSEAAPPSEARPGTILELNHELGWLVAAGQNTTLRIRQVQCANSKAMNAQAYACGNPIAAGDRLE